MACRRVLLFAAVAAAAVAFLPAPASAKEWMVGDAGGWRAQFNKTGWANGKTFRVGDTLMFMYPKGAHTVIRVGKEDFAACNLQGNQLGAWYSGEDVVALDKPGKMWFLCSKPGHCDNGMKLAINVVEGRAPAPAPAAPAPSTPPPAPSAPAAPPPAPEAPAPAPAAPAPSSAPLCHTVGSAVVIVAGAVAASVLAF